ncbi:MULTISPECIES: hypothetical protein [unclassified Nocardia]|uniref:hypothetical protein n=1 Tax=unclassified Nocardia TaxID=2637762 RepID=UPI0024A84728|nr:MULTISPECIES: hypothetical protein [unclassified Nocardia]
MKIRALWTAAAVALMTVLGCGVASAFPYIHPDLVTPGAQGIVTTTDPLDQSSTCLLYGLPGVGVATTPGGGVGGPAVPFLAPGSVNGVCLGGDGIAFPSGFVG